jgi:hypothetical protein
MIKVLNFDLGVEPAKAAIKRYNFFVSGLSW